MRMHTHNNISTHADGLRLVKHVRKANVLLDPHFARLSGFGLCRHSADLPELVVPPQAVQIAVELVGWRDWHPALGLVLHL